MWEKLLDLVGEQVASWPCECPDTHRRSGQVVAYCPRHALGPTLVNELIWLLAAARSLSASLLSCEYRVICDGGLQPWGSRDLGRS